ncbi:MAG: pyrroline-5-carboxylate reductase dimerization domain-containing protein [Propionicimonas sp.]|uniref:pyrroline-5-carboxylate reductase family protein n=1 Tax=Propionicimonas sp. TaxID=1955623 RepID=UPI003D0E13B3
MAVGIIGLGRLGGALAKGLARAGGFEVYAFSRTAASARDLLAGTEGIALLDSAEAVFERCDVVFVWMGPDDARAVLASCAEVVARRRPFLVSSTPGVRFDEFGPRWATTLPNVNLSVGQGATLLTWGEVPSDADREAVLAPLRACGAVYEVDAEDLGFYCGLTSNGPALYARVMDGWADTVADRHGYDRQLCREMVRQTVAGTIALQAGEGIDAAEVIRRVAHPGASTEQGLRVLDAHVEPVSEEVLRAMGQW